ncbi:MAG: methyl-accepting chemotaxis protein [Methylococcales bacterium]|nr:methyl-accepting chemotaxis protein [Methylococcales bacterium]MDD5753615.1 methyl-accepting chemotaxis protein [Methylococcales bacterium]
MFNNLTIKLRLILLIGLMSVIMLINSGIGLFGISESNDNIEEIFTNKMVSAEMLGNIRTKALETRLLLNASIIYPNEAVKNAEKIENNLVEIDTYWEVYAGTPSSAKEQALVDKFIPKRQRYIDEAIKPGIKLIKSGNVDKLDELITDKVRSLFPPYYEDLEGLIRIQSEDGKMRYEMSKARFSIILWMLIGLILFGLLASIIFGNVVIRGILKSLTSVRNIANAVAQGDLTSRIDADAQDETREMLQAMQAMQNTIFRFIDAQKVITKRHNEGFIYDEIDVAKFQGSYADMARSMNSLVKSHIDVKMNIVDIVSEYAKGDFKHDIEKLPGEKAKITNAINSVKTALLGVNTEIETLTAAAAQGDFSKRANANNYDFMFKSMLTNLNTLVETCDTGFNDVLRVANALANGDLTQTITKDYPGVFGLVKVGMNNTSESLTTLLTEIKETTSTISAVSTEIASGNNDLAHRTEQQAAALEETASSMQELTSTVQHNSENAKQANTLAVGATETANKGVSVVKEVVSTMDNINESSLRIVDIISVIDDIAFQTNILALNAAVEAARAGEQGKGFAVVAIEVRNLAQRAANAAGEIKRLISDSVERVSGGSKQVAAAGQTMQEIVNAIEGVNKIIAEIASASAEQSAGISQVGQAIASMDDVTQQNAALVEEVAATAESLETQTQHLAKELAHFKTGHNAGSQKSSVKTSSSVKSTPSTVKKSSPTPKSPVPKVATTFTTGNDDWEEF